MTQVELLGTESKNVIVMTVLLHDGCLASRCYASASTLDVGIYRF